MDRLNFDFRVLLLVLGEEIQLTEEIKASLFRLIQLGNLAAEELKRLETWERHSGQKERLESEKSVQ